MTCSTCQALEHSEPGQLAAVARYALDQANRTSGDLLALRLELLSTAGELSLAQERIVELEEIVQRLQQKVMEGNRKPPPPPPNNPKRRRQ